MSANKLTVSQKYEVYDRYMREGVSYRTLAAEYGMSVNGIGKIVRQIMMGGRITGKDCPARSVAPQNVIFPAIEAWRLNKGVTIQQFAEMCEVGLPTLRAALYDHDRKNRLKGNGPTMRVIDAILQVTGLTYEEAFRRTDAEEGAGNDGNAAGGNP